MPNRLANEASPYLRQHANNPVDWFPWDDQAWAKARVEGKPVFLSIGYATCHWCHVMAHESFEDQEVAAVLNDSYVAVKVDREERPDVDLVYMAACQAMTGQGGWPLSAFLTPDGKPFYVGTYFPKMSAFARPGFLDLSRQLAEKWQTHREVILKAADQLTQALQDPPDRESSQGLPGEKVLRGAFQQMSRAYDSRWGGFGQAPKFPTPHYLNFLLNWYKRSDDRTALDMVDRTLTAMRQGGIYDHLGWGFHRYSVDEKWLIPHFEKMLYDQALLALAYTAAWQLIGKDLFRRTAEEIFTYVLRDLTSPQGGFYSAEDADSEGQEGRFYVWRPEEIKAQLGHQAGELFCAYYGVTNQGNFEHGRSVLHQSMPLSVVARELGQPMDGLEEQLSEIRVRLLDQRGQRLRPLKDDKIITAWNGLMIAALARAGRIFQSESLMAAAARAADFISTTLMTTDQQLFRSWCGGRRSGPGFLEDYAFFAWGLIELSEAAGEVKWLHQAVDLTRVMMEQFQDESHGGFYFSGKQNEPLIARKKETYDGAVPSGNSVAAMNLLRLGVLTGAQSFVVAAQRLLRTFAPILEQYPMAHTHMLMVVDQALTSRSKLGDH